MDTKDVKDELCGIDVGPSQVRGAETSAVARVADGLYVGARGLVVAVHLDHHRTAVRLHRTICEDYGHQPSLRRLAVGGPGARPPRYVVALTERAAHDVARRTGLLDRRGRPVAGLPAPLIGACTAVTEGLWRGAFLARGTLVSDGRSTALNIACPGLEAGVALVGAARRLGVSARQREVANGVQVTVRNVEAIADLLEIIGAPHSAQAWTEHHRCPMARATDAPPRLLRANARRSEDAAARMVAQVRYALSVLGEDVPTHLELAGRLRLAYPTASLEELGRRGDPPLSKDTIAGRLRRLISTAERATNGAIT